MTSFTTEAGPAGTRRGWFRHRAWIPVAWIVSLGNLASVWFAVRPGESPWHATLHAAFAVAFALWARHLQGRSRA